MSLGCPPCWGLRAHLGLGILRHMATSVNVPPPRNDDVELLGEVVRALIAGEEAVARHALGPIARQTLDLRPVTPLPTLPRRAWVPGRGPKTRNPPIHVKAQVFARDHFTCRYCARWTIPVQVLRLLSLRFPEEFPVHPNWKRSVAHRLYWDISTSLDHVVAVSRDGQWNALDNVATACSRCQYQKNDVPLEVLGWSLRDVPGEWDGLTRSCADLWNSCGRPAGDFVEWIRAFETAENRLSPKSSSGMAARVAVTSAAGQQEGIGVAPASEPPIRTFAHGDDGAYEGWVARHGGYVLVQRSGRRGEYMLHDSDCSHLMLTSGSYSLTTRPRRWAKTRRALAQWTVEQTGSEPRLCRTCM